MNLTKAIYTIGLICVLGSSVAYANDYRAESLAEVAVAQENADGTYDLVCTNGNRETVSAVDLRLGNVCPNDKNSRATGVLSLQKRSDGDFDVTCRDLSKIVATTEQILRNEVCANQEPEPQPEIVIEDGVYSSRGASSCTIRGIYTGGLLTGLHASFPGTTSDMTCSNLVCTGRFSGYPQLYTFKILSKRSFEYSYDNGSGRLIFQKE